MKKLIKKIWKEHSISYQEIKQIDKNVKTILKGTLKQGKHDKIK
jgi:hypothetical protein